jgi:nucleoside-diphosphate-sugar epimerase
MRVTRLVCLGLGYSAQALARLVLANGGSVAGTARTAGAADALRRQGYDAFVWDGADGREAVARALSRATHAVVSAAPGPEGDPVLCHFASDVAAARDLAWIGYLSTVGVYGDTQGGWVDEASPVEGDFDRTRWRIAAEAAWLAIGRGSGKRVQVYRLAGIYGPGRSAFDTLRAGRAQRVIKPGQVFNRVHVDDIARALQAGMAGRGQHDIYNVADDEPAPPQDVITYAAELMGVPAPPEIAFEDAQLSDMARSFYLSNRRVSNARLKGDLGVRLAHPTYRDGLEAIARGRRAD